MDFGTISTSVINPFNATPVTLSSNSRITDNIVRVGLNYKLDPARGVYDVLAGIGAPSVYKALPYKAPAAYGTPIQTPWTWAGFYVGGTIGYGWGKSNTDTVFSDPVTAGQLFATNGSRKLEGAIGGAQGGYNWVAGNMLAGVEADLNHSGQRARMRAGCPGESAIPLSSAS